MIRRRAAQRATGATPDPDALPRVGLTVRDPHGVAWRVVAVHETDTPRVTLEAGSLRLTCALERFTERYA